MPSAACASPGLRRGHFGAGAGIGANTAVFTVGERVLRVRCFPPAGRLFFDFVISRSAVLLRSMARPLGQHYLAFLPRRAFERVATSANAMGAPLAKEAPVRVPGGEWA